MALLLATYLFLLAVMSLGAKALGADIKRFVGGFTLIFFLAYAGSGRMGLGMFIAGGVATVLIVLWDPIHGNPISLGMTQWRFLVLAMAMFIVGFSIEMVQAYSLSQDDEKLLQELMDA